MTDQLDLDGLEVGEAFCPAFYQAHIDEAWRCLRDGKPYTVNADGALAILNRALDDRSAVKALITRLRAAEAATAAAVGWQDISTAPKDGTWFLAYGERLYPEDMPKIGCARWRKRTVDYWEQTDAKTQKWVEKDESDWDYDNGDIAYPTHWMPLPSTPVAGEAK